MGCKHSADCKDFSSKIKGVNYSKWDTVAVEICKHGIQEKFVQNPILLEILVKRTGSKCIIECTKDRLWGTGVALAQDDCLDSDHWITPGIMGKILENIHMEFSSQFTVNMPSSLIGVQSTVDPSPLISVTNPVQTNLPNQSSLLGVPPTVTLGVSSVHATVPHPEPLYPTENRRSSSVMSDDNPAGLCPSMFHPPQSPPAGEQGLPLRATEHTHMEESVGVGDIEASPSVSATTT